MVWVKFHEELTKGAKRGIAREYRFVLMELALICRPKRGWVDLPLGMNDADGVFDLLGGNRNQVVRALQLFTLGDDPSVIFSGEVGSRRLSMPKWSEWNSSDVSTERVKKHRVTETETRFTSKRNASETLLEESREEKSREDSVPTVPATATAAPTQLVLTPTEPEKPRAKPAAIDNGLPKPETATQIAWRLWRKLYSGSRRGYGYYAEAAGDGRAMRAIAENAKRICAEFERDADIELLITHWFRRFLLDDGHQNCVANARHPIRMLDKYVPTYGLPWRPEPSEQPPAPRPAPKPREPQPELVPAPLADLKNWSPKL